MNGSQRHDQGASLAWIEYTSPEGRAYYFNRDTRVTTWEKPDELKTPQERDSVWKEYSKDGRAYWYNTKTKQSTWTRPDALRPQPEAADADRPDEPNGQADVAARQPRVESPRPMPVSPARRTSARHPSSESLPAAEQRVGSDNNAVRGSRSRPPVPPSSALDTRPSGRREYRTAEEAEKVFADMLRRHNVGGDWSWEQMLRAVANDPDYRALKTLPERKDAFRRFASAAREVERETRRAEQRKQRDEFFALLDSLPISEYTRFRKVRHLAGDRAEFLAVPSDKERAQLLDAYIDEHVARLGEERRQTRSARMREATEFLGTLPVSASWEDVKERLVAQFDGQLMPILQREGVPLDTLYFFARDKDSVSDPESGLSMLDLMEVYERAISDAERREAEQHKQKRELKHRTQRQHRDAFRQLLAEHSAQFTPTTTWTEFYPQIKGDARYLAMLGQPGSSPLDLFWDQIELLSDELYHERKRLESAMREHGFGMQTDTPIDAVRAFASGHCDLPASHLDYIYEQLVIKARRRQDEEDERRQRHRRRQLEDFKYALYKLEPALAPESTWDEEKARIGRLPEFKAVGDEAACREVFDLAVERQRERAQQRLRKRRDSEPRKRSRSPVAAAAGTDKRSRRSDDPDDAADSSELEEGEMVG
ncbi:U1 snRNP protein [Coemansia sp. RSA 2610]|nr:U1 snRNP protein [Coemansia sp. RSA 2610]